MSLDFQPKNHSGQGEGLPSATGPASGALEPEDLLLVILHWPDEEQPRTALKEEEGPWGHCMGSKKSQPHSEGSGF